MVVGLGCPTQGLEKMEWKKLYSLHFFHVRPTVDAIMDMIRTDERRSGLEAYCVLAGARCSLLWRSILVLPSWLH